MNNEHNLIHRGNRIVVAVSGGADSVALLLILLNIRSHYTLNLAIAHLDHGLRENSTKEALYIARLAKTHNLPFYVCCENLLLYGKHAIEERARNARYAFLQKCAVQFKAHSIAVAHHANDQAETILFNIIRGSSVTGLGGMPYKRKIAADSSIQIIRPLLSLQKSQIVDYLATENQQWMEDESNADTRFTRNKIRRDLIPFLQSNFSAKVVPSLNKMAIRCQEIVDFMDQEANKYYDSAVASLCEKKHLDPMIQHTLNFRVFDEKLFAKIPTQIMPFLMKRAMRCMQINTSVNEHHYKMLSKLQEQKTGEIDLSSNVTIHKKPGKIYIYKRNDSSYMSEEFYSKIRTPWGWFVVEGGKENDSFDFFAQWMDKEKIQFPLRVRSWKREDVMKPLGAPGKKKIQKILKDIKLHEPFRDHVPVVVDHNERIVWLVGVCVSHHVRITEKTTEKTVVKCLLNS
ncbi:tRNA lysidine(34) synthetase TilS [Candidatus Uabimicrobium amorphum]|uniref:tRNA lysidine(34) synthetase TilS n=1 Tax=Uabimicrobium amorphum TaxID=2596890 RepID=UPI0015639B9E|nr:tRNA lysidine(34) synthetase TilS [Candidatus Uabimicrobium amorphum]